MSRKNKPIAVNLRTRIPLSVAEELDSLYPGVPRYKILRDIVVTHIGQGTQALSMSVYAELSNVARATGYRDVNGLLSDLAAAFLRVYNYNRGLYDEEEPTPAEEIREMFNEMDSEYEKGLSIRVRP